MTDESAEYQLSPRVRLVAGDACRLRGPRTAGLWRFVRVWTGADGIVYVDVVGPIGRSELLRTFRAERLKSGGRVARDVVAMHAELRALSRRAHGRH